eukprot:4033067-Prymnesium_polylepis.1
MALLVAGALGLYAKRRGLNLLTKMVEAAEVSSTGTEVVKEASVAVTVAVSDTSTATSAQTHAATKGPRIGCLVEMAGRLGVKVRILISLAQVLSQVTTTYKISYPDFYAKMLDAIERADFPIKLLPFGCQFRGVDNYMFDLVMQTALPFRASLRIGVRARSPHIGASVH